MATVRTHDAMVPLDRTVTLPHTGQTAVTQGIMRFSMDSTALSKLPFPTSADAYVSGPRARRVQCRQHVVIATWWCVK